MASSLRAACGRSRTATPSGLPRSDEEAARLLLRAHLAVAGGVKATVEWLTSAQQWAIRECLAAGLERDTAHGAVLLAGELGPLRPYLPSGAYL